MNYKRHLALFVVLCLFLMSCYTSKIVVTDRKTENRPVGEPVPTGKKNPVIDIIKIKYNQVSLHTEYDLIGRQAMEKREVLHKEKRLYKHKSFIFSDIQTCLLTGWTIGIWGPILLYIGVSDLANKNTDLIDLDILAIIAGTGFLTATIIVESKNSYKSLENSTSLKHEYTNWKKDGFKKVITDSEYADFMMKVRSADFIIEKKGKTKYLHANNADYIFTPELISVTKEGKGLFDNLKSRKLKLDFFPPDEDKIRKEVEFYSIKENIGKIKNGLKVHTTKIILKDPLNGKPVSSTLKVRNNISKKDHVGKFVKEGNVAAEIVKNLDFKTGSFTIKTSRNFDTVENYTYTLNGYTEGVNIISKKISISKTGNLNFTCSRKGMGKLYEKKGDRYYNRGGNKNLKKAEALYSKSLKYHNNPKVREKREKVRKKYKRSIVR